jgi:hypothetical protein
MIAITLVSFDVSRIIEAHKHELGAVICEAVQRVLEPDPTFLHGLRDICTTEKIPLIFDEIAAGGWCPAWIWTEITIRFERTAIHHPRLIFDEIAAGPPYSRHATRHSTYLQCRTHDALLYAAAVYLLD